MHAKARTAQTTGIILILLFVIYMSFKNDFQKVTVITSIGQTTLFLKAAYSQQEFYRGLMFINYLPKKHGMIFIQAEPLHKSFWMNNTFIPLDILFINEYGEIFQIYHAAKPGDRTELPSQKPCKYIIELKAGEAEELGITRHSKLLINQLD